MLRLLQALFGTDSQRGYPESLVRKATERAIDATDPWLRSVSGYRKKLRPAVICAIDHVIALVDDFPPVLPFDLRGSGDDLRLKSFFLSAAEMTELFTRDRNLTRLRQSAEGASPRVFALLAMEMEEKVIFGAELSGDIILRDVPRETVSFHSHRLIDPDGDHLQICRNLKRRAFDHLLSLALKRLSFVKSERKELAGRRQLLQAKLNLLQREGWGFDKSGAADRIDESALEERLAELETQLEQFGGADREMETYLQIVAEVLGNPDQYLHGKKRTIYVDRMAIRRSEPSDDAQELTFTELRNAEGRRLAVLLVSLQGGEL